LVENRRYIPPLFGAPVGDGVNPLKFRGDFFGTRKLRVPGLSYGVVFVILGSDVVTDL